jgi:hypothetical protein
MSSFPKNSAVILFPNRRKLLSRLIGLNNVVLENTYCNRSCFDSEALIYSQKTDLWYKPSSCVWADDRIQLPGKLSLASEYKARGLATFFVNLLGIPKPSLAMHVMALAQKSMENASKDIVMQEMMNICALDPTAESLQKLSDCKCLPIRKSDGTVVMMDRSAEFSILDRREYEEIFRHEINIMDFSLEQVHTLMPFLLAFGLQDRYISRQVKEETKVQGGFLHQGLTDDLRKKAYAICR